LLDVFTAGLTAQPIGVVAEMARTLSAIAGRLMTPTFSS
jgi:hypothetical protein